MYGSLTFQILLIFEIFINAKLRDLQKTVKNFKWILKLVIQLVSVYIYFTMVVLTEMRRGSCISIIAWASKAVLFNSSLEIEGFSAKPSDFSRRTDRTLCIGFFSSVGFNRLLAAQQNFRDRKYLATRKIWLDGHVQKSNWVPKYWMVVFDSFNA